jgi:ATP-binding cassette, subfamily A (ABC1), member 3
MSFGKFRILLWKNWIIQKRHWKRELFEIVFPVLLVILFTWIKSEYTKNYQESKIDSSSTILHPSSDCNSDTTEIVFSPASPWVEQFLGSVYKESAQTIQLKKFENSAEMDKYLNSEDVLNSRKSLFGIEFDDLLAVRGSSKETSVVTPSFVFSGIK